MDIRETAVWLPSVKAIALYDVHYLEIAPISHEIHENDDNFVQVVEI